jgi:hypothetical protein
LGLKIPKFFENWFNFFVPFQFVKFMATKKVGHKNFLFPLLFLVFVGSGIRDTKSRIRDRRKSESGINIPDPQHCADTGSRIPDPTCIYASLVKLLKFFVN